MSILPRSWSAPAARTFTLVFVLLAAMLPGGVEAEESAADFETLLQMPFSGQVPLLLAANSGADAAARQRRRDNQDQQNDDDSNDPYDRSTESAPGPLPVLPPPPPPFQPGQPGVGGDARIAPANLPPPPQGGPVQQQGQAAGQPDPAGVPVLGPPPAVPPRNPPPVQQGQPVPQAVPVLGPPPAVPPRNVPQLQPNPQPIGTPPRAGTGLQLPAEGPKINRLDGALGVYNAQRVTPVRIDPNATPQFTYQGNLVVFDRDGNAIPYNPNVHRSPALDPNGQLVQPDGSVSQVGTYFGGGANSKVYASLSNKDRVKKFVYLSRRGNAPDRIDAEAQTLTDQDFGRAVLGDIKEARPWSPFRVAQRDGGLMTVKARDANNKVHIFALSREENIASQVVMQDVTNDDYDKTVNVTNAEERRMARPQGQQALTLAEELTVNLVLRDLNQNGVVWTDHKLANFDIVPDDTSPTGHRMVFFDLDAFRAMRGPDRKARYEAAREFQRIFDSAPDLATLQTQIRDFENRRYPDGQGPFDYTAVGGQNLGWLASPGQNRDRQAYRDLNFLNRENFRKTVDTFNASNNRNARYEPPPR